MNPDYVNEGTSPNEAARAYIEEGFAVLPAPVGEKEAKITGWPQLVLGVDAVDEYFPPGEPRNLVRINGTNSGGRGDIDLDRPEALRVARYLIPEGTLSFGREGQSAGHIEVQFADTVPRTTKFALPGDGDDRMVVELRADGSQTLLPPSIYPDGTRCVWQDGEVLVGHAVTLRGYVEDVAAAALLLLHYPGEGGRHEFWLGAIGMLIKSRHPAQRVRAIVEATARSANDSQWRDRLDIIDTTVTKFMVGERIAGKTKLAKVAPDVPQILKDWLRIGSITDSGLPQIVINNRPLREVSDEATDALVAANEPPEIFARSGNLARLAKDAEGRPVIQDIDKDRLRYRMTRTAEYLKVADDLQHVFPPDTVVADVLAAKSFAFPELVGITQSPALRPSGTVLDKPGYDKETKLAYIPEEDVDVQVPMQPTTADVEAAVELLRELFVDFPFVDESSLANMLALTLTPVVRPAYGGPTPLAVIDKPSPGTGASLLSEVVCAIATARPAAMMSPPDNDEETRKQITAVLRTGRPIIVIDNLGSEMKNASWSRVLTSTTWEDRILGHSRVATLPQRSTWITSGNNVKIGGDLPRRCYWIRMDAKLERPWDRQPAQFTHPELLEWVGDQRGALLGALLTLARNWYAAGKPKWSGRPPGSFEGWAQLVGGILQAAGIPGFLGNAAEMFGQAVPGAGEWEAFLSLWFEKFGSVGFTARDLIKHLEDGEHGNDLREVLPSELAFPLAEDDPLLTRKFGETFSEKENVRHGDEGLRISRAGTHKRSILWSVVADDPGDGPGDGPVGPPASEPKYVTGNNEVDGNWVSQVTHPSPAPGENAQKQLNVTNGCRTGTKSKTFPEWRSGESPDSPNTLLPPHQEATNTSNVRQLRTFTLVETEEALARCVSAVKEVERVGVDLETTGLAWWKDKIRLISLTTPTKKTFVVDVAKVDAAPLYEVLEGTHLVVHNAVFDIPFLKRAGCNPAKVSCTEVLSRLRWAGRDDVQHSLDDVIKRHASGFEAKGEVDHDVWKQPTLPEEALVYAASDTKPLLSVYDDEIRVLERVKMSKVAELEEKFLAVVIEAAATGLPVAPTKWGAVIQEAVERKRELAEQLDSFLDGIVDEVPEKFAKANAKREVVAKINWSSPEQKIWALEALGIPIPTKWDHKKKEACKTLDKNHLHLIEHPISEAIRDYQAIANFPSTFARAIEERFADGWVYPDWQQLRARTGRMSCQSPPMHNVPKKSKLREAIVAPAGQKVITLDFSQIEPRVLAATSGDRTLLTAYKEGKDIYCFVASKVTGVPMSKISNKTRSVFKTIVLGLLYGMTESGLALRIHRDIAPDIPVDKVVAYRDGFFAAFPEASKWREDLEAEFDLGSTETRTILNRRRLKVENRRQRWNAPIQGTACDAFKQAAVELHERSEEVGGFRIVALIHDEVVLLAPEARAAEVEVWARNVMSESAASVVNAKLPKKLHIPIEVDSGSGKTLQEAKDTA